ncbi:Sir2 family NAD+-dependent deacetylase [Luteolibacter pohnpeiensis]|uniref:Sir2 family NAD+-dependent deacetylase n=1 Tax=Luteolibacter pohnpeiensis TaxID=454153 RepID=UPI001F33E88E|nr:Sir2 family NAD+-dependent deacetylase [Luteolibacter pohnpeiensis]
MHRQMNIVILTGAGISAESGVPVFRGPDGLWEGHRVEDVATPEAFEANPELVHRFYNQRRAKLLDPAIQPNAAHLALARLEKESAAHVLLITQNIDDLHERAGSENLLHLHGELLKSRCTTCGNVAPLLAETSTSSKCQACGNIGTLRPHIVWFGEMPFHLEEISSALRAADWFVSIGTSGNVYPAAGFVSLASHAGARTLELNLDPSQTSDSFQESRLGPATQLVPAWVNEILG